MPDLLVPPAGANMTNCHGLVTDKDQNIYLTYDNSGGNDPNCLIRWKPDGSAGEFMTGGNTTLCKGVAHGLNIATEEGTQYLYHANNKQKLTKTHLDGPSFGKSMACSQRTNHSLILPLGSRLFPAATSSTFATATAVTVSTSSTSMASS